MFHVVSCGRIWSPGYQWWQKEFEWWLVSYSAIRIWHWEARQSHSAVYDIEELTNITQRLWLALLESRNNWSNHITFPLLYHRLWSTCVLDNQKARRSRKTILAPRGDARVAASRQMLLIHISGDRSIYLGYLVIGPVCPPFCFLSLLTTHNTNIHAPSGIWTRNPSKRSATDPRLRPLGRWDRHRTQDCPFRSLVTIPTTPQRPCYNCDGSLQCTEPGSRGHSIVCVPRWMSEES